MFEEQNKNIYRVNQFLLFDLKNVSQTKIGQIKVDQKSQTKKVGTKTPFRFQYSKFILKVLATYFPYSTNWQRPGLVVKAETRDREVLGSFPAMDQMFAATMKDGCIKMDS